MLSATREEQRQRRTASHVQQSVYWLHPLQVIRPCFASMYTPRPHRAHRLCEMMLSAWVFSIGKVSHRRPGLPSAPWLARAVWDTAGVGTLLT